MSKSKTSSVKTEIGSAEFVEISRAHMSEIPARIDTGARTSSIWVSSAVVTNAGLVVMFFGPESSLYTGKSVIFEEYETIVVASSNGQAEQRYKVKMPIKIYGRIINASFSLADRSTQVYPVLVGRNILRGKFTVDVSKGKRLIEEEKARSTALKGQLKRKETQ